MSATESNSKSPQSPAVQQMETISHDNPGLFVRSVQARQRRKPRLNIFNHSEKRSGSHSTRRSEMRTALCFGSRHAGEPSCTVKQYSFPLRLFATLARVGFPLMALGHKVSGR